MHDELAQLSLFPGYEQKHSEANRRRSGQRASRAREQQSDDGKETANDAPVTPEELTAMLDMDGLIKEIALLRVKVWRAADKGNDWNIERFMRLLIRGMEVQKRLAVPVNNLEELLALAADEVLDGPLTPCPIDRAVPAGEEKPSPNCATPGKEVGDA